jgi:GT2 family glycosyltransferase
VTTTVIVPTHVGGSQLERLLDSLARQTVTSRTIVVDNAAPEGVAALVARHEFAEHLRSRGQSRGRAE